MDLNSKLENKAEELDNQVMYSPQGLSKLLLEALNRIQQLESEIEVLKEENAKLNSNFR
jgi:phage shock protein A